MQDFRPLPLLSNSHVQTIMGCLLWERPMPFPVQEHFVTLPDGDRLAIYDCQPPDWTNGDPIVISVHGLCGSHRSGYLLRLGKILLRGGVRVVRVDLRGAGNGVFHAKRTYNAACSEDLREVVTLFHEMSPQSEIGLAGFSLGGNVVLKLAGEAATNPVPGLSAVAAACPPIDLAACCELINRPENRFYDRYFGRELVRQIRRHQRLGPDVPKIALPNNLRLRELDEIHTAPLGGFRNADDYYNKASAFPLVSNIQVPVLILAAEDDPFICIDPILQLRNRPGIEVKVVSHGGHLGFLGFDGAGGYRWSERYLGHWLMRHIPNRSQRQWAS